MINDRTLVFDQVDAINFMMAVAAGTMPEQQAAQWIRQRLKL
jgi:death-on-curing protein